jgi:putative ABC transport system permease protein
MELRPKAVSAAMIGLKSKLATFKLQRFVNEYPEEPLSAILPGAALQELWSLVGTAETALAAVSAMVVVTALLGMVTMILATLNERRREMAILRSVGARPTMILGLLVAEAGVLGVAGAALGIAMLYVVLAIIRPLVDARFGLYIAIGWPSPREAAALAAVIVAGLVAGLVPALRAYRFSVSDGMMVKT